MEQVNTIQHIKENYQDTIFSTQITSSLSPLNHQPSQDPKNIFRISSKLKDQPRVYYKKMKERKSQAESNFQQHLRNTVKARGKLHKLQKDAAICRNQFLKLYHNKKFKLLQSDILSQYKLDHQYNFRLSKQHFKRQKMYNDLSISLRKEKKQREEEMFRQTNRYKQHSFRETLKNSNEKLRRMIFQNHQKVKQHKEELAESKKKLQELSFTKSKFNYMAKINEEMRLILQYNHQIQQSQNILNPEQNLPTAVPVKYPKIN